MQEEEKDSNDVKNEVKLAKRPISLTLIILVGAGFLLYLLLTIFPLKNFSISSMLIPFLVFMPISFIISLILFRSNRKKNQKRAKSFAIVSGASVVLFFLAFTLITIFLDNIEAGNSYFNDKQYEKAIVQYYAAIEKNKDFKKVEIVNNKIIEAQNLIKQAENFISEGDSYFKNNLFGEAILEYNKAKAIYPYFKGLDKKISETNSKIEFNP